jgi:hypothetical protein
VRRRQGGLGAGAAAPQQLELLLLRRAVVHRGQCGPQQGLGLLLLRLTS